SGPIQKLDHTGRSRNGVDFIEVEGVAAKLRFIHRGIDVPTDAEVQSQSGCELPIVLEEERVIPVTPFEERAERRTSAVYLAQEEGCDRIAGIGDARLRGRQLAEIERAGRGALVRGAVFA